MNISLTERLRSLPRLGRLDMPVVLAAILVAGATFLALLIPARLSDAEEDSIQRLLTDASVSETGLELRTVGFARDIGASFRPPRNPQNVGLIPSPYEDADQRFAMVEFPRYLVNGLNGERVSNPAWMTVRVHEDFDAHATVLASAGPLTEEQRELAENPIVDVSLTTTSADTLGWELGDLVQLRNDSADLIVRSYQVLSPLVDLRVAELVELSDPTEPVWWNDARLHEPLVNDTHDGFAVFAHAAVRASDLAASPFLQTGGGIGVLFERRPLPPSNPSIDVARQWEGELQRITAATPEIPTLDETIIQTGLGDELSRIRLANRTARNTLSLLLVALATLVALGVARLTVHTMTNRRDDLTLLRARGTSAVQLGISAALSGIAIGAIASVIGVAAAFAAGGGRVDPVGALRTVAITSLGVAGIGLTVVLIHSRRSLADEIQRADPRSGSLVRGVDVLVAAIAVVSVITIRRREPVLGELDIVAALALAATGLALAMVVRRGIEWFSTERRLRTLTADIGLRRIGAGASPATGAVDVIVLAVVIAGIAAAAASAIDDAVTERSWATVGAPVRVEAALGQTLDLDALDAAAGGIDVAGERRIVGPVAVGEALPGTVTMLLLDSGPAAQLTRDDPVGPMDESELSTMTGGRLPVLVPEEGVGNGPIAIGSTIDGIAGLANLQMDVVGTHRWRGTSGPTLLVDRRLAAQALGDGAEPRAALLDDSVNAESLLALSTVERVVVRSDVVDELAGDPQTSTVRQAAREISLIATIVALLLSVTTAVLVVHDRRSQTALLGALGMDPRRATRVVNGEILVGVIAGIGGGLVALAVGTWLLSGRFEPTTLVLGEGSGRGLSVTASTPVAVLAILVVGSVVAVVATTTRMAATARTMQASTLRQEVA